jgi:hypothetical protein
MVQIITWPEILCPAGVQASPVPMTRSGGPTLAGIQESILTDVGWWSIKFNALPLTDGASRRLYNAIRTSAKGRSGIIRLPVWSHDSAEWPEGAYGGLYRTPHSDGSLFSDDSMYTQPALKIILHEALAIGDVVAKLRVTELGPTEMTGIRWSYNSALYENGLPMDIDGLVWTVPIFPAVRAAIPAEAELEVSLPTCLVHLATDREMDGIFSAGHFDTVNLEFVEAHDYWSNLA